MHPMVLLSLAIVSEIVATTALKASEGFTRPLPAVIVVVGYGLAFYLLALSLRHLPLGMAYAIWAGMGTVGTALLGALIWHEVLTIPRMLGIGLIVAGVVVLNMWPTPAAQ